MIQKWTRNQLYNFCQSLVEKGYTRTDNDDGASFVFESDSKIVFITPTEAGYLIESETVMELA